MNARDYHSNSMNAGLMYLVLNEVFSAKQKESLNLEDEGDRGHGRFLGKDSGVHGKLRGDAAGPFYGTILAPLMFQLRHKNGRKSRESRKRATNHWCVRGKLSRHLSWGRQTAEQQNLKTGTAIQNDEM